MFLTGELPFSLSSRIVKLNSQISEKFSYRDWIFSHCPAGGVAKDSYYYSSLSSYLVSLIGLLSVYSPTLRRLSVPSSFPLI